MPMLAFDHRGSFEKMMQAAYPDSVVTKEEIIELKRRIIDAVAGMSSGVLIDQDYGLPAYEKSDCVTPFLLPLEKTGYTDEAGERVTELLYSPESLLLDGAQGAKLLLYTNPYLPTWEKQLATAKEAWQTTQEADIPLFVEFVLYEANGIKPGTVVENVRLATLAGLTPEVWKVAYPGSLEACQEMTALAKETPWIVLTGGGTFEDFAREYENALRAGASGFLAGRALWAEACSLYRDEEKLSAFLNETLRDRFEILLGITYAHD